MSAQTKATCFALSAFLALAAAASLFLLFLLFVLAIVARILLNKCFAFAKSYNIITFSAIEKRSSLRLSSNKF